MDAEEEALFYATIAEITANADGMQLMHALDQFGWQEMLMTEPGLAIPAVFQGQGAAGSWSPAFQDVVGAALDLEPDTVALVPFPGNFRTAFHRASAIEVRGLLLGQRPTAANALASLGGSGQSLELIRISMSDLRIERISGLDPALSASLVSGSISGGSLAEEVAGGSRWECALADGRWALSYQLIGIMDAMQALALTHALERSQFGQQIGSFQAIRHRLAETHVAIEAARAAAGAAGPARSRSTSDLVDAPFASMLAKLIAGRSATRVTAHCQQVLAGIGFTSDHPFHRYMKRAIVLEKILGDTAQLTEAIGRHLVARGKAPRVVDL
jgi:hypothetical protein